jgi:hypothetical protein
MAAASPLPSMMVVVSLLAVTRRASPRSSTCTLSSLRPTSSLMTRAPVRVAMSSSMALRRSPKPGAFTARTLIVPFSLLTTRVASASPSTSSAMMRSGLPVCTVFSSVGRMSATALIFLSVTRMYGWSRVASSLPPSVLVTM